MDLAKLKVIGGAGLLVGMLFVGSLYKREPLEITAFVGFLVICCLLLESWSPKRPGHGFISTLMPVYMCLAVMPGFDPLWAALVAISALILRSLVVVRGDSFSRGWEFLADAIPICVALLGPELSSKGLFLCALLHIGLRMGMSYLWAPHLSEPQRKAWHQVQLKLGPFTTLNSLMGIPIAFMVVAQEWTSLLVPLLCLLMSLGIGPLLSEAQEPPLVAVSADDEKKDDSSPPETDPSD